MLKRFRTDTGAAVALMFGLLTVPLIAAAGAAVDYSRAYEHRHVVQDALDSAALAANRLIGFASEAEIYAEAMAFFNANTDGRLDSELQVAMVIDGGTVELTTELPVPTTFLGIVGVNNINFDLRSVSEAGAGTYEIVMVLDNSGSMRGSKIATLRTAATDLVDALFALSVGNPQPDPVKVGIVPFAASVNVGPDNAGASWMDAQGQSPNASLNFDDGDAGNNTFTNTFDIWDDILNTSWRGCVEARPYPHDVTDTTPTAALPATLFVPMFAPDEPGRRDRPANGFSNSYIDDNGGVCSGGLGQLSAIERQERTCKYQSVVGAGATTAGEGPHLHCTGSAILPLADNNNGAITSAIAALGAQDYTNIAQGIIWGWHLLSDNAPFSEGRPYGTPGNQKVLIVMTDGANTYISDENMNQSEYMAFNYITHNQLGVTTTNNSEVVAAMNQRTLEVCANIHDTEISVYTVAFQVEDDDARQILRDCATSPANAFESDSNEELIAAFRLIAQDIATLRLAE